MIFKPQKKPNGFGTSNAISNKNKNNIIRLKLDSANRFRKNGEFGKAILLYEEVINQNNSNGEAFYNLGMIFKKKDELDKSIEFFLRALKIEPNNINTFLMLGNIYSQLRNFDKGIYFYEKGLALNTNNVFIINGLGNAYHKKNDYKKAIDYFQKALKISPNKAGILNNLANSQLASFAFKDSIQTYKLAINLEPNINEFHVNLSQSLFHSLNYADGWLEYEYRKIYDKKFKKKIWEGQTLKQEERLLIHWEEGLGDTIQFIRYAIYLKEKGINFRLCIQSKLKTLIEQTSLKENLLEKEDYKNYEFDFYLGLISLPRILKVNQENVIKKDKYLYTTTLLKEKWQQKFKGEKKPIIGINWQGNPQAETQSGYGRSIPLEEFSSIAKDCQIKFLSLQKGYGSEQLQDCTFKESFVDFQKEFNPINNFLECAAVIENCDLIITTDSCVAHLSGALQKRTFLLLKKLPDWRWGAFGEKTFWYDSVRVFRQNKNNCWSNVLNQIKLLILTGQYLNK